MSTKLDEMLAGLRAGAGPDEEDLGYFTLDVESARTKLQRFQLAEPEASLCRLLELAARAGGELTVHAIPRGLVVQLHRVYFTRVEAKLGMLMGLDRPRTERGWILRDLSVALRGLQSRARGVVSMVSTDEDGAYRVRYDAEGNGELEPLSESMRSTAIRFPTRYLPLPMAFADPRALTEVKTLFERGRWARNPARVGALQVSFGHPGELESAVSLELEAADGVLGVDRSDIPPEPSDGTLHVLSRGVHVERMALPGFPRGVVAVLDMERMQRDASESRLVRNAEFEGLVTAIQDRRRELVRALERELQWPASRREREAGDPRREALRRLRAEIRRRATEEAP